MIYFNYVCIDCDCGAQGKEKDFVVEKDRSEEDEPEYCPNGKKKHELKLVGEKCTILAAKYSGKLISKEEKVKMLKKRASDDYKKNIHERKVEMTRKAIKNFKDV